MIFYTLIFGVLAVLIHSIVKLCFGHFPELEVISKSLLRFTMNNGTHIFTPTVILISLDGFRPDYLSTNSTPNMEKFGNLILYFLFKKKLTNEISATKAPYMIPSFPVIISIILIVNSFTYSIFSRLLFLTIILLLPVYTQKVMALLEIASLTLLLRKLFTILILKIVTTHFGGEVNL
jgi:hypothetical protein